jgi:virginiamycin B lyase
MIGRLDPKSGQITLVTSPTARSRPYGIMVNSKGVPHVVLFGTNKIARVDPKTLEIREYTLPDPGARPRRMAYDGNDLIYYSDYPRGMLGRLDPQSGKVVEWPSPGGPKSEPYGIVFTKGAIWYSESGTRPNTIVRFDPKIEKFQTWAIPSGGYIVRKMDVTPDGNPVIAYRVAPAPPPAAGLAAAAAASRSWSGLTCTRRHLMGPPSAFLAPAPYCSASGPWTNLACWMSTVCTPFSTTVS